MVLSAPARVVKHGILRFSMSGGQALTEENLHQLRAHHAKLIFVNQADTRSAEQVSVDAAAAAHRAMKIFNGADLSDPHMAALFDQVLVYLSL
jgi:hypothetical protein